VSDFSTSPLELLLANRQKGYVGIHIEQGVPILDRDLNLLHDLVAASVRSVVTRYIGDGIPSGADGFAIQARPAGDNEQDFRIAAGDQGPGAFLVGGIEVTIPAPVTYKDQPDLPPLTTPTPAQPDPRDDVVYLDVSLTEVDGRLDPELTNSTDVGVQTSVRLKPAWVVRVAEGAPMPAPPPGHAFTPLARLRRRRNQATIEATMISDLRQRRLTVSELERRLSLVEKVLLVPAFVSSPAPQFVPRSGVINQPVTLHGTNFNVGPVVVRFGQVEARILGAPSPTQIVARVPPGLTPAGSPVNVRVTVANAGGETVSDDTFNVRAAPVFTDPATQFSPANGTAGTPVVLNGFNFNVSGPRVQFGGQDAPIAQPPTATRIATEVPAGLIPSGSTSADVRITVTTSAGTVVSDDTFRAEQSIPAPAFTSPQFVPRSGVGGQPITLNGQNFNILPVSVRFDGTGAVVVGSPSATQISVQVPFGMTQPGTPRQVRITVTTAGGSVTSTDVFTVNG
jgi:IPT/TIG domain